MRRWMMWLPVLMIGSLVYWTIALNFGGLSLMALTTYSFDSSGSEGGDQGDRQDDRHELGLKDSYQPITVKVVDHAEAVTADEAAAVTVDVVPDREPERGAGDRGGSLRADQGPGATAF